MKSLILPSGMIFLLLVLAAIFLVAKNRKTGVYLTALAGLLYIVFGFGPFSFWLLGSLEYRYPPIHSFEKFQNIRWIVVLSGYAERDPAKPLSSEVNDASAFRIIEANRISRQIPDAGIVFSGFQEVPEIMKELAVSIGIPLENIFVDKQPFSTYESAVNLKKTIGNEDFILVTSAGHMPRAVGVFRKQKMNPIPAPTDYRSNSNILATSYRPSPLNLENSDLALHEYLGIIWYILKGRI